jgi:hypothetical protein
MNYKALARRLAAIETASTPRAVAWQDCGEHGTDAGLVQLCAPGGVGEHMTLDEWHRRHPDGQLIRVVYGEQDAGDVEKEKT